MVRRYFTILSGAILLSLAGCVSDPVDAAAQRTLSAQREIMENAFSRTAPAGGLTLEAAIEYALANNLSVRAAELEYAIEDEAKTAAKLRMLPSLQANLGASERNRYDASSSQGLYTGKESLRPSYSSEKTERTAELRLVWSLMDFGLSYIRAKQAAERELIAEQNLRRLRQQIVMDTVIAYYRLRAADDIARVRASVEDAVRVQLEVFKEQVEKRNLSRNEANRRALPLLTGLKSLQEHSKERQAARINLAKAMGVPRPEDIVLSDDFGWASVLPSISDSPERLYQIALENRPEMYRADSNARVSQLEAKSALLQLAPNVNLSASLEHNPDKYLVYHNWMEAAVRASWDMLRLPAKYKDAKTAGQKADLAELRVGIAAASVLVQINLALLELDEAGNSLALLDEIEETRRLVLQSLEESAATGKGHGADALSERIRYINDYADRSWGRADYMAAYARLLSGLGLDPWQAMDRLPRTSNPGLTANADIAGLPAVEEPDGG